MRDGSESDHTGGVAPAAADFWVFGYGSLMWRPGFPYDRAEKARLTGYHRAFCIYSTNHRGNDARPGLVLGLDRGGVCDGVAFRVPAEHVRWTRRYLAEREQVNGVYLEKQVPVALHGAMAGAVTAQAYVVERAHPSYAGQLALGVQARLIRAARGRSGCNLDYLVNTLHELRRTGIREPDMERIGVLVGACFARDAGAGIVARPSVKALRNSSWRRGKPAQVIPRWQRRRFVHRRVLSLW